MTRLDHLVILVRDLEGAAEDYERLGFRVTPGGEHADGLTRNVLVPFRDGTYLELVAFLDPEDDRDNVWGWRGFSPREGLIDYCAAPDGLQEVVERLKEQGFRVEGPSDGGRSLPDGREIRWRSASIGQDGRVLPFLIEDLTPREARVPGGPPADHPNGATGLRRLELSAPDVTEALATLNALTGNASKTPVLGACGLSVTETSTDQSPGPTAVELSTDGATETGELNLELARGVRFHLLAGS